MNREFMEYMRVTYPDTPSWEFKAADTSWRSATLKKTKKIFFSSFYLEARARASLDTPTLSVCGLHLCYRVKGLGGTVKYTKYINLTGVAKGWLRCLL